jgi:hypothetical protein
MDSKPTRGSKIRENTAGNSALYFMYLFNTESFVRCLNVHLVFAQCNIGWAGDGRACGSDRDLDSWPDYDLGCADAKCRKVGQPLSNLLDFIT